MNMFFNTKRTLALAALLATATPALQAMTSEDLNFIEQITQEIKDLIQSSEARIKAFTDPRDTTSLDAYTVEFHNKIKFVHAAVLVPLQQKLADATLDHNSTFGKTLKITEELVKDLYKEFEGFHKLLISADARKSALKMATELGKKVDQLKKKYDLFEQKLVVIHKYLAELSLTELTNKIGEMITLIKKAKVQKELTAAEKTAIVLMLKRKMK